MEERERQNCSWTREGGVAEEVRAVRNRLIGMAYFPPKSRVDLSCCQGPSL